ncbi:MAG: MFS transporter [SAR202 cluster bacterium]|nr:MFS transporter [SAR202 cluster bacterium]
MKVSTPWRALFFYIYFQPISGFTFFGLTVALPLMAREFGVDGTTIAWVPLAYGLGLAGSAFITSTLTNYVPLRTLILAGLVGDLVLMTLMVVIDNIHVFLFLRFLQGLVRMWPWLPLQVMSIGAMPKERRGRMLGITALVQGIGLMVGVPLGGIVTDLFGWRWVIVSVIVLLAPLVVLVRLLLPPSPPKPAPAGTRRAFDFAGSLLIMAGVALTLTGLQFVSKGTQPALGAALLVTGVALLGCFVWWELRVEQPVLELRIFKIRPVVTGAGMAVWTRFADGAVLLLLPFLFQQGFGWSVAYAGGIMFFLSAARPPAGPIGGWLADRLGNNQVQVPSAIGVMVALAIIGFVALPPNMTLIVAALLLIGICQSTMLTANQRQLFNGVPQEYVHAEPNITLVSGQIGNSAGQALGSIAPAVGAGAAVATGGTDAALVQSFGRAMLALAVVYGVGTALSYLVPRWLIRAPAPSDDAEPVAPETARAR